MKNSEIYTGMRFTNDREIGTFTKAEPTSDSHNMWIEWVFDSSPNTIHGKGVTYRSDGESTSVEELPYVIEEEGVLAQ